MTNNIRDFRNAGGDSSPDSEKSNTSFYACVIAIPLIAAIAGVAYKPLMELRSKNVAAVQQAELDMEARRRAENPLYALMNAPTNEDGLIDSNDIFGTGGSTTSRKANRNPYADKPMTVDQYLTRLDAKADGFSPIAMETLKYERASRALSSCGQRDMLKFYVNQNKRAYDSLKAKQDASKDAKRAQRVAQAEKLELPKIENKTQALAFVASGGVGRHQEASMNMFAGLGGLMAEEGKHKITRRKFYSNKRDCSRAKTIVQSGAMTVKTNIRLR